MQWILIIIATMSLIVGFAMMVDRAYQGRLYEGYLPITLVLLSVALVIVSGAF